VHDLPAFDWAAAAAQNDAGAPQFGAPGPGAGTVPGTQNRAALRPPMYPSDPQYSADLFPQGFDTTWHHFIQQLGFSLPSLPLG